VTSSFRFYLKEKKTALKCVFNDIMKTQFFMEQSYHGRIIPKSQAQTPNYGEHHPTMSQTSLPAKAADAAVGEGHDHEKVQMHINTVMMMVRSMS
jgi:hypothetical protein